jgi:hypothetical protein
MDASSYLIELYTLSVLRAKLRPLVHGATCTMSAAVSTWELKTRWEKHPMPNKHSDDLCSDGISMPNSGVNKHVLRRPLKTKQAQYAQAASRRRTLKIVPGKYYMILSNTILCYYTLRRVAYDFTVHDASQCLVSSSKESRT